MARALSASPRSREPARAVRAKRCSSLADTGDLPLMPHLCESVPGKPVERTPIRWSTWRSLLRVRSSVDPDGGPSQRLQRGLRHRPLRVPGSYSLPVSMRSYSTRREMRLLIYVNARTRGSRLPHAPVMFVVSEAEAAAICVALCPPRRLLDFGGISAEAEAASGIGHDDAAIAVASSLRNRRHVVRGDHRDPGVPCCRGARLAREPDAIASLVRNAVVE